MTTPIGIPQATLFTAADDSGRAVIESLAGVCYQTGQSVLVHRGERIDAFAPEAALPLGRALYASGLVSCLNKEGLPTEPRAAWLSALGALVASCRDQLPPLTAFVRHPAALAAPNGTLQVPAAGLDTAGPHNTLVIGSPPHVAVERGYPLLHRLFSGIPASPSDRANLLVWTVTIAARPALPEFPLLLLRANRKSVGKTRCARAIAALYGEDRGEITFSGDEARTEFALAEWAGRPAPNVICIDNVRAKRGQAHLIRSQALSAMATSAVVQLAPKGRGLQPVFAPVVMLNMNDARVEADLADKVLACALFVEGTDPCYLSPDPPTLVAQHLQALRAEILAVLGGLSLTPPARPVTRFGQWEAVATGVAERLGVPLDLEAAILSTPDTVLLELLENYHAKVAAGGERVTADGVPVSDLLTLPAFASTELDVALLQVVPRGGAPERIAVAQKEFARDRIDGRLVRDRNALLRFSVADDRIKIITHRDLEIPQKPR